MSSKDQHEDAVAAAQEWRDEERRKKYSGGWISGGCADDAEPGTFVVLEERPADSAEPPVVREGNVVWVDSGSGPGFSTLTPSRSEDDR